MYLISQCSSTFALIRGTDVRAARCSKPRRHREKHFLTAVILSRVLSKSVYEIYIRFEIEVWDVRNFQVWKKSRNFRKISKFSNFRKNDFSSHFPLKIDFSSFFDFSKNFYFFFFFSKNFDFSIFSKISIFRFFFSKILIFRKFRFLKMLISFFLVFPFFWKVLFFFSNNLFFEKIFLRDNILFFIQVFFSYLDYIARVLENWFEMIWGAAQPALKFFWRGDKKFYFSPQFWASDPSILTEFHGSSV